MPLKLPGGSPPESDGEPRTESTNLEPSRGQETLREISGEVGTVHWTSSTIESPVVEMSAPELRKRKGKFFHDTGSNVSLIKLKALAEDLIVNTDKTIEVSGIGEK